MTSPLPSLTGTGSISPRKRAQYWRYAQYAIFFVAVALMVLLTDWPTMQRAFANPRVFQNFEFANLASAIGNTLLYTILGFSAALGAGLLLALMKLSDVAAYRWVATLYVEFFRGVPALLVFIAINFGVPLAFQGVTFTLETVVTLALGIVGSAYIAETIRAGIQAVPRGQIEAARSLGLSGTKTMLFVVIPQAFRIILPPLTNELILLTKDSSLIYIVGLAPAEFELTQFGRQWMNSTNNLTPLLVVGLCYLIITVPLGFVVRWLERRNAKAR